MSDSSLDHDPLTYHSSIESPVDYVPRWVVSLVPSLTESLFDLDLGDRLIAISDDCKYPADGVQLLSRVGGPQSPDLDRIISLQPDLVLLNDDENRIEDIDALRAADMPVWITGPRTVFDALNVLWSIMDIFDHPAMVPRVREIERAYDYTNGASRAQTSVRVFAPLASDPWMTFNASAFSHDLLRVCGGQNVFADAEDCYPEVSLDEIEAAQPDVMLVPVALEPEVAQLYTLDVPAAHNERIYAIDGTLLTWHGTRIAFALRDVPALLMEES
jgi:ABC-type Fe3+-hydroxamate transport system substrate-binding protein